MYTYGRKEHYADDKFTPCSIYSTLIEAYQCIQVSDRARVEFCIYSEPSSGKTWAAKMFMTLAVGDENDICPGFDVHWRFGQFELL